MNINRRYITKINFTDKNSTARIKYIVIHYFGGLSTALNLAKYWAREYAGASAHYVIGHEGEIFQIVEDDDVAWHCGAASYKHAECRNTNSIGIEMAVKKENTKTLNATDKDWYFTPETVAATVELTKQLMKKYNIPAENVIRHYDVTGKICPNPYYYNLFESTWQAFKAAISAPETESTAEYKGATDTAQEKAVWDFLTGKGLNAYAAAGLMGNLYAESGFNACNLQNSFNTKLGLSDMEYTARVDSGAYTNFVKDGAGYGLAQWTYYTRKQALLDYAKAGGYSVGNLNMQLDFLWRELTGYKKVMQALESAESIKAASDAVLTGYEKPADQSEAAKNRRAGYGEMIYNKYTDGQDGEKPATGGAGNATQGENAAEVKQTAGSLKIIYTGADGVNYRATPDYNAAAAGQAHAGDVFTVVGEIGDFYKLKSGWYITKRADLVQFTEKEVKRYAKITYTGADGVNYRATPDYNAAAAGQAHAGDVFTIVGESGDFYKLKAGWYLTKRYDLVELIEVA